MAGEFLAAQAVIRAEHEDAEGFREVFAAVLQRLEGIGESERDRWRGLVELVLSFGLLRRPAEEHEGLLAAARDSQIEKAHWEEIARMNETLVPTWEQELLACGRLREARGTLRMLLEDRFGPLPGPLVDQIETTDDLDRLRAAIRQVLHLPSLSDLVL